jgi:hypothetical protein
MNANSPLIRSLAQSRQAHGEFLTLLDRLRQDQLEAALVGRLAESAFYANEARALRQEFEEQKLER